MTDEIDSYRAAKLYIDQHGELALFEAAIQSDALLEAGDMEGSATWRKYGRGIGAMT